MILELRRTDCNFSGTGVANSSRTGTGTGTVITSEYGTTLICNCAYALRVVYP